MGCLIYFSSLLHPLTPAFHVQYPIHGSFRLTYTLVVTARTPSESALCTPSEFRLRRYSCPPLHSLAISILLLSLVATSKSLLLCLSGVCRAFGSGDLVLCQYCSCWWCGKNASGFHLWSGSFSGSVGTNAVGGEGMPKPT